MPCKPDFVDLLLHGDDDSVEVQAASRHVESCPDCRRELERLTQVDSRWWNEACACWSDEGLPAIGDGPKSSSVIVQLGPWTSEDHAVDAEPVALDFLTTPSHPELLGRLGRYDIERVVGTGGMGVVLKAHDSELHRTVAIKVLAPHLAHNVSARRRFSREAQAAAAVVHPHVIPIYNVESDGKIPYLVMQYVAGHSLQGRVDERGALPVEVILRIAQQTAAGLAAAHAQGLVHRDVKPANILLEGDVDRVLLSDFGLARAIDDASLSRTGIVAGTPYYMSPEQAQGEAIDYRSDLFSLGAVIYFMLAGRPPFRASGAMAVLQRICHEPHRPLHQVNPETPLELSEFVDRLLAKTPEDRVASAEIADRELGHLLARWQQGGLSLRAPANAAWWDRARPWFDGWLRRAASPSVRSIVRTLAVLAAMVTVGGFGIKHLLVTSAPSDVASPQASPLIEPVVRPESADNPPTDEVPLDVERLPEEYAAFRRAELQFDADIQRIQQEVDSLTSAQATPFQVAPAPHESTFEQRLSDVARQLEEFREEMQGDKGSPWPRP